MLFRRLLQPLHISKFGFQYQAARCLQSVSQPVNEEAVGNEPSLHLAEGVSFNQSSITIDFRDGSKNTFPTIYLRDHQDTHFHPTSHQRLTERPDFSDAKAIDCQIESTKGDVVTIKWGDGTSSEFNTSFLKSIAPLDQDQVSTVKVVKPQLWDQFTSPTCIDNQALLMKGEGNAVAPGIEAILRDGIVMIENVPATADGTQRVCESFGALRRTFYSDGIWDTQPKNDVNDTAYTKLALQAHTDGTYFTHPPGLQCFNCVSQSDEGGESTFVDGFSVAHFLRVNHPEVFDFFSTTELPFQHMEKGIYMKATGKVIDLDPHGQVKGFRYNHYDRAPFNNLTTQQIEDFYRHLPILLDAINDEKFVLRFKLKVGQLVIINNTRVLHGREAFKGTRNLVGGYIDMDDFNSTARVNGLGSSTTVN